MLVVSSRVWPWLPSGQRWKNIHRGADLGRTLPQQVRHSNGQHCLVDGFTLLHCQRTPETSWRQERWRKALSFWTNKMEKMKKKKKGLWGIMGDYTSWKGCGHEVWNSFSVKCKTSLLEANWAVDTASEDTCRTPGRVSWLPSSAGAGKFGQERYYSELFKSISNISESTTKLHYFQRLMFHKSQNTISIIVFGRFRS